MATTTRRIDLDDIHAILGAIIPDFTRTDNKIITVNGRVCQIFVVQTVTTTETNLNLATKLVRVQGGVVKNITDNTTLAIAVTPLSTNASTAVVNAVLPADKTFIVIVYGTETR